MKTLQSLCLAILMAVGLNSFAISQSQDAAVPGSPESYATMHCIGIDWPITGDADHDASCRVEFRKNGEEAWHQALNLIRCDSDRQNALVGSIFSLEPGTSYDIRLQLADPDGGDQSVTMTETTRAVPVMPAGRTFHVVAGNGGGAGTAQDPFKGIVNAEANAQPGDTFLLHAGDYGVVELTAAGAPDRWIMWKAAGDGNAIIRGMSARSWVWLDGLSFLMEEGAPILQNERYIRHGHRTGLAALEGGSNVCVTNCSFNNFHYSIEIGRGCSQWYIADNVIVGDNDPINGGLGGEGVEINKSRGNVIAYNHISCVADGVSYPGSDCDIYGNDIVDVSDDGIETDMGQKNNRVWGNRITNACNNVFSFQPMNRGPWYFIRNQVIMTRGVIWKFVTVNDRFVALHNTFVFPKLASQYAQCLLLSYSRNNLYIAYGDQPPLFRGQYHPRKPGPGRTFTPDWMTDVDYDGFDWNGMTEPFVWDGKKYADLAGFSAAIGIEKHGVRVKKEEIFENWSTPTPGVNPTLIHLALKPGSAAVDSGEILPNINDSFTGIAPDLGALELGQVLPQYGPRQ